MQEELPHVSVLVAARNEEQNIERCLLALLGQDYPSQKLHLYVGDDLSTDRTGELARRIAADASNLTVHTIRKKVAGLAGKTNVLAQLARLAKGTFLLFTDADIAVNPQWVGNMVKMAQKEHLDVLTGVTLVDRPNRFAALQSVDWLYAQLMVAKVSDWGLPVTAMGNNMLVSQDAYQKLGGYEALPFSITEDYALFKAICAQQGRFKNHLHPALLAVTRPLHSLSGLFRQRKRWMHGAMQLPWYMLSILFLQAAFFPLVLLGLWNWPFWALPLWGTKVLLQSVWIQKHAQRLGTTFSAGLFLQYEAYLLFTSMALVAYYYWPTKVTWKGRAYRV